MQKYVEKDEGNVKKKRGRGRPRKTLEPGNKPMLPSKRSRKALGDENDILPPKKR